MKRRASLPTNVSGQGRPPLQFHPNEFTTGAAALFGLSVRDHLSHPTVRLPGLRRIHPIGTLDGAGSYRLFLNAAAACLVIGSVIAMFLPPFDAATVARPLASAMRTEA